MTSLIWAARKGGRTSVRALVRPLVLAAAALAALLVMLVPSAAQAHSLESSTISTHVTDDGVDATISIALETLDEALGTDYTAAGDVTSYADEVTAYLAEHLSVTSVDGTEWGETFSDATRETVEGIESFSVDVSFDTGGSDTSGFEIAYDAVIEAVPGHEAVVVLTDAAGEVSTPGVISSSSDTVTIGSVADAGGAGGEVGIWDMVGYGFHHVLEGADHLLFLTALLLTAPVVVVAGRWRRRTEVAPTLGAVVGVVTSFTIGHSITLIASALGWVQVPTQLVEVLVAASVGVAAVHAIRPLVRRGENLIAGGFGLVHGLAFAGILSDLGFDGTTSLVTLLAFNVGVELAQLTATLMLFPSLYLMARTRFYPAARVVGGGLAIVAAIGWVLERLGALANPFGAFEDAAIGHPMLVVVALLAVAACLCLADRILGSVGSPPSQGSLDAADQPRSLTGRSA